MKDEDTGSADGGATPQERLRALELSGDPDAWHIAQEYKDGPFDSLRPSLRQVSRQVRSPLGALAPSFARATGEDADEAEAKVAALRARRTREQKQREAQLFAFAKAADRREKIMIALTVVATVVSAAALVVAIAA